MDAVGCKIQILWDDEARVWIATSPDIPGLVLESGSVDALIERVRVAASELLEIGEKHPEGTSLDFSIARQMVVA
jgi:Zn-finger nucleic acid-binding protein